MKDLTVIENKIYEIRGQRVMLDFDLAALYQVTTSALNQAVKRNMGRFPDKFMFRLSDTEWSRIASQSMATSVVRRPKTFFPYAFTEHGVAMLAAVLRSQTAIEMNVSIMKSFVAMGNHISTTTPTAEPSEIRAKLTLLERGCRDNADDVSDLSQDMRKQLDKIYEAIGALSARLPEAERNAAR